MKYYVMCMIGCELKVKVGLIQKGLVKVKVPSKLESTLVKGKLKVRSENLYPGYVIVEVEKDDPDTRGLIKTVPYVSKVL